MNINETYIYVYKKNLFGEKKSSLYVPTIDADTTIKAMAKSILCSYDLTGNILIYADIIEPKESNAIKRCKSESPYSGFEDIVYLSQEAFNKYTKDLPNYAYRVNGVIVMPKPLIMIMQEDIKNIDTFDLGDNLTNSLNKASIIIKGLMHLGLSGKCNKEFKTLLEEFQAECLLDN